MFLKLLVVDDDNQLNILQSVEIKDKVTLDSDFYLNIWDLYDPKNQFVESIKGLQISNDDLEKLDFGGQADCIIETKSDVNNLEDFVLK